jgi:hypothetical protein
LENKAKAEANFSDEVVMLDGSGGEERTSSVTGSLVKWRRDDSEASTSCLRLATTTDYVSLREETVDRGRWAATDDEQTGQQLTERAL